MLRKGILRWGGLLPLVGFMIWLVLTPLMATIWLLEGNEEVSWESTPLIVRSVGQFLVERGMDLSSEGVYFGVGRYFFLVYLSMIVGLYVFHSRVKSKINVIPRSVSVSQKLLLISLSIAAISDFVSYGLGVFSEFLWRNGFPVEMFTFIFVFFGSTWYGTSLVRARIGMSVPGGLLIVASMLVPAMIWELFEGPFIGYMPNGPVLPYIVVWSLLGLQTTIRRPSTFQGADADEYSRGIGGPP